MMRRRLLVSFFIAHFSLLFCVPAQALREDRDQPLRIDAASVTMNEKTGVAVYRGNVRIVQGSMRVEADRVEVLTRNMRIETVTATGRPVRLRALLDDRDDELRASAERLVLNARTRELDLTGNVLLRHGGDQFSAAHIHYALDDQQLTAKGTGTEDGRVYAIIQPQRKKP
jgi:lipopolysaccharide export system protein LptA